MKDFYDLYDNTYSAANYFMPDKLEPDDPRLSVDPDSIKHRWQLPNNPDAMNMLNNHYDQLTQAMFLDDLFWLIQAYCMFAMLARLLKELVSATQSEESVSSFATKSTQSLCCMNRANPNKNKD